MLVVGQVGAENWFNNVNTTAKKMEINKKIGESVENYTNIALCVETRLL